MRTNNTITTTHTQKNSLKAQIEISEYSLEGGGGHFNVLQ